MTVQRLLDQIEALSVRDLHAVTQTLGWSLGAAVEEPMRKVADAWVCSLCAASFGHASEGVTLFWEHFRTTHPEASERYWRGDHVLIGAAGA